MARRRKCNVRRRVMATKVTGQWVICVLSCLHKAVRRHKLKTTVCWICNDERMIRDE